MTFSPSFTILGNADGSQITLTDVSGLFNGTTNTVGYGAPDVCTIGDGLGPFTTSDIVSITVTIVETVGFTTVATIVIPNASLPATYVGDFVIANIAFPYPSGNYNVSANYQFASCNIAPTEAITIVKGPYPEEDIEACLDICLSKSCNILDITENTSFDGGCPDNDNGWPYNPSLNNDVRRLFIEVYDETGLLLDIITIIDKDALPAVDNFQTPHVGSFDLPESDWLYSDGYYTFKYKIEVARPFQPNYIVELLSQDQFFYCNAQNCVNLLWHDYIVNKKCDEKITKHLLDKALQGRILLDGAKTGLCCLDITKSKDILTTLAKICDLLNDTKDCGCV